ncbi:MAG: type III-A CRISPR-associated protein Csm2 [Caldilineaceae bacterium]
MSDVQARISEIRKEGFYKDGRVKPELFGDVASDLGQAFAMPTRGKGSGNKSPCVSSNQLRGFYGEVKALEIKLQEMSLVQFSAQATGESGIAEEVFRRNEYLVRMIAPKVAYIQGKQTGGNVSREFREFIETSLAQVHTARDFMVFMRLFESVVGFFYGFGGGKN